MTLPKKRMLMICARIVKEPNEKQRKAEPAGPAERSPELIRRDFIKRFGVYAAGTSAGLFVLMSPKTSKALGSNGSDTGP